MVTYDPHGQLRCQLLQAALACGATASAGYRVSFAGTYRVKVSRHYDDFFNTVYRDLARDEEIQA